VRERERESECVCVFFRNWDHLACNVAPYLVINEKRTQRFVRSRSLLFQVTFDQDHWICSSGQSDSPSGESWLHLVW
jgi:hypothetical protein